MKSKIRRIFRGVQSPRDAFGEETTVVHANRGHARAFSRTSMQKKRELTARRLASLLSITRGQFRRGRGKGWRLLGRKGNGLAAGRDLRSYSRQLVSCTFYPFLHGFASGVFFLLLSVSFFRGPDKVSRVPQSVID